MRRLAIAQLASTGVCLVGLVVPAPGLAAGRPGPWHNVAVRQALTWLAGWPKVLLLKRLPSRGRSREVYSVRCGALKNAVGFLVANPSSRLMPPALIPPPPSGSAGRRQHDQTGISPAVGLLAIGHLWTVERPSSCRFPVKGNPPRR